MKNLYYLPYQMHSGSVKEIQDKLGGLKIRPQGNYAFRPNHLVVNWGNGNTPYWGGGVVPNSRLLNHWGAVSTAVNKLKAFQIFKEKNVPTPDWTSDRTKAEEWVRAGRVVFCRTKLSAMEGKGIVIATTPEAVIPAPLYTRLFPKNKEYRVHVFKGEVIDYVQKKLAADAPENRSKYIRNTANGWIFARSGIALPEAVSVAAKQAVEALKLDFGAVDLAISAEGRVAVFEVNTAPGIEGTTIEKYTEAITKYGNSLNG
jgi:hypothetical protein